MNAPKNIRTKRFHTSLFFILLMSMHSVVYGQNKPVIGIVYIETNGVDLTPQQAGDRLRLEVERLNMYSVIDKWDLLNAMSKEQVRPDSCKGKNCLVSIGKTMNADKMLNGEIDRLDGKLVISLRLIDVATGNIEKTEVDEYIILPESIQLMLRISLAKLTGQPYDEAVATKLVKKDDFASELNVRNTDRLKLNGPRMGVSVVTGEMAKRFSAPLDQGGYDYVNPVMFIFGYQQEIEYLNSGNFQALVEMVPAVVGLDKGLFIPSFSFMNGFRDNRTGWEFAFGPNFTLSQMAKGYYSPDGSWHLQNNTDPAGINYIEQFDKRGDVVLRSAFIFAAGKSFKSGRMNIPLNIYFIPGNRSARLGFTFGFNAPRSPQVKY